MYIGLFTNSTLIIYLAFFKIFFLLIKSIEKMENKENEIVKRHEEYQYLDQIRHILANGNEKMDRTKVGTKSVFGHQSRYSLRNSNQNFRFFVTEQFNI